MNTFANAKRPVWVENPKALVEFGWAPGGYICKCGKCGAMHADSDKRSPRCQDCAIELRDNPPRPAMHFGLVNQHKMVLNHSVNSFRVGCKWYDLVTPGDIIDLKETGTGLTFGTARIDRVISGHWYDLKHHAKDNQTWRHLPGEQAEDNLCAELARVYPDFSPNGSLLTVVYLTRLT